MLVHHERRMAVMIAAYAASSTKRFESGYNFIRKEDKKHACKNLEEMIRVGAEV